MKLLIFVALALASVAVHSEEMRGHVVAIADGDTLTLLVGGREQVKIRLAEIDTPEKRQPYGNKARQALAALAFKKETTVMWSERDRYGRVVGRVFVDGLDVNAEMVRQGHAWVYRQYASDESLFALENEAKAAKRGLWALSEADKMPPWEWRRARRSAPKLKSTGKPFTCGTKSYCKEMQSCEEARFYLTQCGLDPLDGDKDGVPCEAICR